MDFGIISTLWSPRLRGYQYERELRFFLAMTTRPVNRFYQADFTTHASSEATVVAPSENTATPKSCSPG